MNYDVFLLVVHDILCKQEKWSNLLGNNSKNSKSSGEGRTESTKYSIKPHYRIVKVARDLKPKFLTLLGTPISAIIGTDLKGLSNAIQSELDIPVFCIETKGIETYVNGASRLFWNCQSTF